jgi:hypothetical protein
MKGLLCFIYKHENNDSSNGGISSKTECVVLCKDNTTEIFEVDDNRPGVKIVKQHLFGKDYYHAEPIVPVPEGHIGYMFGGTFIYTSDSRFPFNYPLPLHDRSEFPNYT